MVRTRSSGFIVELSGRRQTSQPVGIHQHRRAELFRIRLRGDLFVELAQPRLFVRRELAEPIVLRAQIRALYVVEPAQPLLAAVDARHDLQPLDPLRRLARLAAEFVQIVAQFLLQRANEIRRVELRVNVDVVDHRQIGQ